MKEAKLRAKQAQEMEVLQARSAKGREQLKRAHAQVQKLPLLTKDDLTCVDAIYQAPMVLRQRHRYNRE